MHNFGVSGASGERSAMGCKEALRTVGYWGARKKMEEIFVSKVQVRTIKNAVDRPLHLPCMPLHRREPQVHQNVRGV